jgi:hypothetical protein
MIRAYVNGKDMEGTVTEHDLSTVNGICSEELQ